MALFAQVSAVLKALDWLTPQRGLEHHQCVRDLNPKVAKIDENYALLSIRTLYDLFSIDFRLRESASRSYLSDCFTAHVRNLSAGGDTEWIFTCLAPYSGQRTNRRLCLNDNGADDDKDNVHRGTPAGNKTIREIEPPLHLNGSKKFQHKRIFGCKKKVGTNSVPRFQGTTAALQEFMCRRSQFLVVRSAARPRHTLP